MYHLNGLLTVCGRDLVYTPDDTDEMEVTLKDAVENSKKTLVGIGTKILIFPDKLAFDTASRKVSALGAVWSGKNTKPTDGQLFLRVEDPEKPWSSESTLEVYSEASGNWSAVVLDYCRISAKGVGTDFAAEDTVTLTGSAAEQAGQWNELDGDRIVYDAGTDALRVKADPGGEWFYGRLTRTGGKMGESGRQRQPGVRLGRGGGAGTPGAGHGLPDRVRQPGVGMLQQGERHLRLQAG